jgi:8-oxo-dGTP pyrophosphatase MutT (NUDIX family)
MKKTPQPWQLLSKTDVSPSKWFPIENRTYKLPNGRIVDDFTVTTIADVSMIIPITKDKKVVMVNQFKPGLDSVMLQFPAGRIEPNHHDMTETAQHELEEETGIKVEKSQLKEFGFYGTFPTKASEKVFYFLVTECEFNSEQNFDENEDIEVLQLSFDEIDRMIDKREIWCIQSIGAWFLAKKKFPEIFATT